MAFKYTGQPAEQAIPLADAKTQLRVTTATDDAFIQTLIESAIDRTEKYLNRPIVETNVSEVFDEFAPVMTLGAANVSTVATIHYLDTDGVSQLLADTEYTVDTHEILARIFPKFEKTWPSTAGVKSAVTVVYSAGWADADSVPRDVIRAMLMMITSWYFCRDDSVRILPTASEKLLKPYKICRFKRNDVII